MTTIRDVPLFDVLEIAARTWPDRPALGERTVPEQSPPPKGRRRLLWHRTFGQRTFAQLHEEVLGVARKLVALGVRPGDHVALWAANRIEWVQLEFALARLGAVLVTANTALGREDLAYLLRQSEARFLIADSRVKGHDFLAVLRALDRASLPCLERIALLEEDDLPDALRWSALAPAPPEALPPPPRDPDALVNMQYTSGTTGFPKGVMLSSRNIVNNAWSCGQLLGLTPEDKVLVQVPLFHCFGCVVAVLGAFTHGASIHLIPWFDPQWALQTIRAQGITCVHGVPTMFQALLDHADAQREPIRSVRTGIMAGAVCPRSLMERLIRDWGAREMTIGFGLTEASPHVCYTPRDSDPELRCGTIGIPIPGTRVRLVDPETGEEAERGEIQLQGEGIMLGYWRNEQATRDAILPGPWLRTGDMAERLPNGYLRIAGRLKEMVLRGGENIYPAEVEEAVRHHPAVAEVAVFGVPDERLGEELACAIIPRPGASITLEELRAFLLERIAKIKVPRYLEVVEALPLTASGKVQRFVLTRRWRKL
jgi:fatty-acyl-CoA synthase